MVYETFLKFIKPFNTKRISKSLYCQLKRLLQLHPSFTLCDQGFENFRNCELWLSEHGSNSMKSTVKNQYGLTRYRQDYAKQHNKLQKLFRLFILFSFF